MIHYTLKQRLRLKDSVIILREPGLTRVRLKVMGGAMMHMGLGRLGHCRETWYKQIMYSQFHNVPKENENFRMKAVSLSELFTGSDLALDVIGEID